MAKASQPKPFGPTDLVVAPGTPDFQGLVKSSLAGVGDAADPWDRDVAATATSLASVPHALNAATDALVDAHNSHEALRAYDPGVAGVFAQAASAVAKTSAAFEQSLAIPGAPATTQTPPLPVSTSAPAGPVAGPGGAPPGQRGPAPGQGPPRPLPTGPPGPGAQPPKGGGQPTKTGGSGPLSAGPGLGPAGLGGPGQGA